MEAAASQQGPSTTRRAFLKQVIALSGVSAGTALLAACGAASTTTAVPVAQQPTTAPTTGAAPTAEATTGAAPTTAVTAGATSAATSDTMPTSGATAEATAPVVGGTTTGSTGQDATPKIVAAANAFLATLSDTEKDTVLFDWTDTAQRQRWSNFPEGAFKHAGLMMGNMSATQQAACLAVLQSILSTEGYNRVIAEWKADDPNAVLEASASASGGGPGGNGGSPSGTPGAGTTGTPNADPGNDGPPSGTPGAGTTGTPGMGTTGTPGMGTTGTPGMRSGGGGSGGGMQVSFGTPYYFAAIIGTPSETEAWQWQWGGHHITINATIVGPNMSLTPSFIGVQPTSYTDANGTTVRPLGDIEDAAFALVQSLDTTQQQAAILGSTYIDLVLGPGQDGKTIASEGLPASQMKADQQTAFLKLIGHYTGLANDEDAAVRLAEIQSTLDQTFLAWYGPTTQGQGSYFRVTGPTIVIEYSPQKSNTGSYHVHGIYRDPTNDYGAKYTGIKIAS